MLFLQVATQGWLEGAASRIVAAVPATRLGSDPDAGPRNSDAFPIAQTMPLTRVNPVLEQGRGRAPGQQNAHMPHSVILNTVSLSNQTRHPMIITRDQVAPDVARSRGSQQSPFGKNGPRTPQSLPAPRTVIFAVSSGEPL